MPIAVGEKLPGAAFSIMTESGPVEKTTDEIFGGRRVALFAVPGAFTPTCHNQHLPGFLGSLDRFKAKGIDVVACTAVNDVFVMDAWARASGGAGRILFLADGSAAFARRLGLELDLSAVGLGVRSKRYAMIVEDGVVTALNVEDVASEAKQSSAEALLAAL